VSRSREKKQKLFSEGAERLLARAVDRYALSLVDLSSRVSGAVEKYILKDDEHASDQTINDFIDSLQADDLCLIVACEKGNQKAWNDLVERFSTTVRSAARSASSNEDGAEDLTQSIWAELHGLKSREDGTPVGKLAYYSGRGSLAGWLRAVVAQLAVDQHRKMSRLVQTEEDGDFDRIINRNREDQDWRTEVVNPESAVSEKFAAAEMTNALANSIGRLSPEDRLLVKLYYFDGLKLKEAGALLGVHEATASRRLTKVHAELRSAVEKTLIEDKGWSKTETETAFKEVAINLDVEIEPLVTSEAVRVDTRGAPAKS
jgi:RNA polymerase sigma-70 factor, ECF subfamily